MRVIISQPATRGSLLMRSIGIAHHSAQVSYSVFSVCYVEIDNTSTDSVWHPPCISPQQRAFMQRGSVAIIVERCKGCGFCVEFCPTKVLALSSAFNSKGYHPPHAVNAEKCSGCDLCGMYCPDFAIYGWRNNAGAR
jgi:2-oxoglutarate ferredoxin oxidoreductase subunit delta